MDFEWTVFERKPLATDMREKITLLVILDCNGPHVSVVSYLNVTTLMTRVKISTIDHFANVSSHRRIEPRRDIEQRFGGKNHNVSVIICFVYGQIPAKIRISAASSFAPALQISIVDRANEKA